MIPPVPGGAFVPEGSGGTRVPCGVSSFAADGAEPRQAIKGAASRLAR